MMAHRIFVALISLAIGTLITGSILGHWLAALAGATVSAILLVIVWTIAEGPATQGGEAP